MTRIHSILCAVLAILTLGAAGPIRGEEQAPIKLKLHPQAEPTPALKYRLLPALTDQIPGNAAVYYGKIAAEESRFFSNRMLWDKIEDVWPEMPLDQLRREDFQPSSWPLYFLEQGARCKYCDWQLPIGQVPFYTIPLPEAQESRRYARMLAVKARREIAEAKYDDAIQTFQTNYALARNIAQGETLVNGLIGIAMCGLMFPQVSEFVQQTDSPNLYWALATLPSPLIDMDNALEVESNGLELSFPELRDLERANRTPKEWREMFHRFAKEVMEWTASGNPPSPPPKSPDELDELCKQMFHVAKRMLIDRGMAVEKVDEMFIHQVALLHTISSYHNLFDNAAKYYRLPYPQAIKGIEVAIERSGDPADEAREVVPLARQTILALQATRSAIARNDRQIAVLRVVEALRIYGAHHDGNLPEQLSDITEVPIPDDPVTGKPFVYRREAGTAHLEGPTLRDVPVNYEITMLRSK